MAEISEKSVPLEGKEPVTTQEDISTGVPKPELEKNAVKCPTCGNLFPSLETYSRHARDQHKADTSTSTAIY